MRVLIIDNNVMKESWGAQDLSAATCAALASRGGATAYVRRAPQEDLPSDVGTYDAIVISGSLTSAMDQSPWVHKLDELIRRAVALGKPMLGVCYGHQSIARTLGGLQTARLSAEPEYGWTKIEQLGSPQLFAGLPRFFHSFSSHREELVDLPSEFVTLAKSDRCAIQAFELRGKPVFGVQFHPEKSLEDCEKSILEKKKAKLPVLPGSGKKLFDPKVRERIFSNFFAAATGVGAASLGGAA